MAGLLVAGDDRFVHVTQRASSSVAAEIGSQMRQGLSTCAASTKAQPTGCPFAVYVFGTYRRLRWTVDEQLIVQVSSTGSTWSTTGGRVTATLQEKEYFDARYTMRVSHISLYPAYGQLRVTEDGLQLSGD